MIAPLRSDCTQFQSEKKSFNINKGKTEAIFLQIMTVLVIYFP